MSETDTPSVEDALAEAHTGSQPRPLSVVKAEKYHLGMKDGLATETLRDAMKKTDGQLAFRIDDDHGHGYAVLNEREEIQRLMKGDGYDEYAGPYELSDQLLWEWMKEDAITLVHRDETPFEDSGE